MAARTVWAIGREARLFVALFLVEVVLMVFAGGCGSAGKNLPLSQTATKSPEQNPPPSASSSNDACYLDDGTTQISLSSADIRDVVNDHMNDVKRCFRTGRRSNRELCGRIDVQVVIGNTGTVQLSTVAQSSLDHPPTEECIADAFKDWQFPAPKCGGLVIFNYPLELHPNPALHASGKIASKL